MWWRKEIWLLFKKLREFLVVMYLMLNVVCMVFINLKVEFGYVIIMLVINGDLMLVFLSGGIILLSF